MRTQSGWGWLASFSLIGVGVLVACSDGDDPGPGPGAAGAAGERTGGGGEGAVTGSAGSGGTGATAQGGAAGAAGAGAGEGGIGGAPETLALNDCEGNPIALDEEWARYCVVLTSCLGGTSDGTRRLALLDCIASPGGLVGFHFAYQGGEAKAEAPWQPAKLRDCATNIATCDDVLACAGERAPGAECDDDETARCEGELAINCSGRIIDCEKATGEKGNCQVLGSGAAAHAECVVQATCAGDVGEQACVGDKRVVCGESGVGYGEDCAARGLSCEKMGAEASCVATPEPSDPSCVDLGQAACDGDVRTYCSPDGLLFEAPACSQAGELVCSANDGTNVNERWLDCTPAACSEPTEELSVECEGDDIVTSDEYGSQLRIHCPDYGFATCRDGVCAG